MKYVLTHLNVLEKEQFVQDRNVYIEDGKIVQITDGNADVSGWTVYDCKGKYGMPGLINMHAHLFGSGKPSKVLGGGSLQKAVIRLASTKLGHRIVDAMMEANVKQALFSGCTTVRSMGDFFYRDVILRDRIEKGEVDGPRLLVSGPAITVSGGHGDGTFAITGNTVDELKERVLQNQKQGVDWIKICITGGVMDAKVKGEPGELKMNLQQAKAVCDMAHSLGYRVASHTESPEGMKVAIQAKVDTIEHGSLMDDEDIKQCLEQGSSLICTISPALPLAEFPSQLTKLNDLCVYNSRVVLDQMIAGSQKALQSGIAVGLGTDCSCPFSTPYNMWRELYYATKYLGVSNAQAIAMATIENAKILHLEDHIGSIEYGKDADILVLENDPLQDIRALEKLDMVISRGKIYEHPAVKKAMELEKYLDIL
ncbi:MAG: amidohydrolase family protein [Erysipelotrichaceae bacterium]|nr:amidohydrolase family protein [Erysipelotrichaceae bacterium]